MSYQADVHSPYPEVKNNCELFDIKQVTENKCNAWKHSVYSATEQDNFFIGGL